MDRPGPKAGGRRVGHSTETSPPSTSSSCPPLVAPASHGSPGLGEGRRAWLLAQSTGCTAGRAVESGAQWGCGLRQN